MMAKTRKSKLYQLSDVEFKQLVARSNSYSDCLRNMGMSSTGGSSTDILKERIEELHCSTEHFNKKGGQHLHDTPLKDILVKNSSYHNISSLKRRLLKSGLIEYKCSICGINSWNNKFLSLQLDHINGDHTDHRLENLRFLCPNCHSQTETFCGKNVKK